MKPIPYTCPCCGKDGELRLKWNQSALDKITMPCEACGASLKSEIVHSLWRDWIPKMMVGIILAYVFLLEGRIDAYFFYPILVAIVIIWTFAANLVGRKRTVSKGPGDLNFFDEGKLDDTDL